MSMSTHVIGFRPPDQRWEQMKAVWVACRKAGVLLPSEVEQFFGGLEPDPRGVEVEIQAMKWKDASSEGVEVDVRSLPSDVFVVRFYNSW